MQARVRKERAVWAKRYPPLALMAVGILLASTVLPSALNLPQSNPSQTLEYAPVPPGDESAPPGGNSSALGLGSSGGLGQEFLPETARDQTGLNQGRRPTAKKCVGNPPRQTEDLLSPPCVAFFEGNNFGSTHQGVTRDEVRVLFYTDGYCNAREDCSKTVDAYVDLALPLTDADDGEAHVLQTLQKYFNDRFQTYGRFVHFFVYFEDDTYGSGATAETRRADAAENFARIKPYAVITRVGDYQQEYLQAMAQKGVVNFGNRTRVGNPTTYFERYPKLLWSYDPSTSKRAQNFTDFVCQKVVNRPVSFGGNPQDLNRPRKLGFYYTTDPARANFRQYSDEVRKGIEKCGGRIELEQTFPREGAYTLTDLGNDQDGSNESRQQALQAMAAFKTNEITTVIWAGGFDVYATDAAAEVSYRPEWIVSGDGRSESNSVGKYHDKSVWQHAWVIASVTQLRRHEDEPCYRAYKETDPNSQWSTQGMIVSFGCVYYESLRQLFTGIQVAGPRLTPVTMEQGFRAIPHIPSTSPNVPACFYEPGDYTCVKDTIAEWWDPSGQDPTPAIDGPAGCWRMTEGGKRHLHGTWPSEDVLAKKDPARDQCNGWEFYYPEFRPGA